MRACCCKAWRSFTAVSSHNNHILSKWCAASALVTFVRKMTRNVILSNVTCNPSLLHLQLLAPHLGQRLHRLARRGAIFSSNALKIFLHKCIVGRDRPPRLLSRRRSGTAIPIDGPFVGNASAASAANLGRDIDALAVPPKRRAAVNASVRLLFEYGLRMPRRHGSPNRARCGARPLFERCSVRRFARPV